MFKNNKRFPSPQIYGAFKPKNYKSNNLRLMLSSLSSFDFHSKNLDFLSFMECKTTDFFLFRNKSLLLRNLVHHYSTLSALFPYL